MDASLSRHLVLVAEDASVARHFQALLADAQQAQAPDGLLVHIATAAALQTCLDAQRIDLVVLEAAHPEASAIAEQYGSKLPVVLLAGRSEATLAQQVEALGAQDYLTLNPPDPVRLTFVLRAAPARQREVERLGVRLQQARDELRQVVDVAGHDLLQPVRTSSLFLELLQDQWGERLDEDAKRWLASARDGLRRMQHLIAALQAYSQIDAAPLQRKATDLDALLTDTLAQLQERVEATNATVTYDALPTIQAEPPQMQQVLQHLIRNALTFHGEAPPRIHLSARQTGGAWEVAVRDEGIGLDTDYGERIFELFERLHTQEAYPGMGAGLALCRKIINRHGGRLWVESEPGGGATFFFTLPE